MTTKKKFEIPKEYLIDFDKLKVGDNVWDIKEGEVKVTNLIISEVYCIRTEAGYWYNKEGFHTNEDLYPSLYTKNPFKNKSNEFPKLMEVSDNKIHWFKRWVIADLSGNTCSKYPILVSDCDTDKHFNNESLYSQCRYVREITPEKTLELTLEEIANKFNVDVNNLKIKK